MRFPIATNSDDRKQRGATPVRIVNMYLEKNAEDADGTKPYMLTTCAGRRRRLTLPAGNCRGVFARDGVADGLLYAVGGDRLYSIDTGWTATDLGEIVGTRPAIMEGLNTNLLILGEDMIYQLGDLGPWTMLTGEPWEAVPAEPWETLAASLSLIVVSDVNASENPETLAVLGERALSSSEGSDTFDWSFTANALGWPASGFATAQTRGDRLRAIVVIGTYAYMLGSETMQVFRAVGGADADAFDTLGIEPVERGLISRDAATRVDQTLMWVGDDRAVYQAQNFFPVPIINRELELALRKPETGADPTDNLLCFSYRDGSKLFFGVRLANGPAYLYDVALQRTHIRQTWGADAWAGGFTCTYNGYQVMASPDSASIWTTDPDVYTDAGEIQEQVFHVVMPVSDPITVSSIVLGMRVFGQPIEGQGSDPQIMVRLSDDGGRNWRGERMKSIGAQGDTKKLIKMTSFGRFDGRYGIVLEGRITDPVGVSVDTVWLNEDPT